MSQLPFVCFVVDFLYGGFKMVRNSDPDGTTCVFEGQDEKFPNTQFVPVPVKRGQFSFHLFFLLYRKVDE